MSDLDRLTRQAARQLEADMHAFLRERAVPEDLHTQLLSSVRNWAPEGDPEITLSDGIAFTESEVIEVNEALDAARNSTVTWVLDGLTRIAAIVPPDRVSEPAETSTEVPGDDRIGPFTSSGLVVENCVFGQVRQCMSRYGHNEHAWWSEGTTKRCPGLRIAADGSMWSMGPKIELDDWCGADHEHTAHSSARYICQGVAQCPRSDGHLKHLWAAGGPYVNCPGRVTRDGPS